MGEPGLSGKAWADGGYPEGEVFRLDSPSSSGQLEVEDRQPQHGGTR